jgi:hypothetical protein
MRFAKLGELVEMAASVAANWENGNLAEAVNNLARVARESNSVLIDTHGHAS